MSGEPPAPNAIELLSAQLERDIEACKDVFGAEGVLRARKVRELSRAMRELMGAFIGEEPAEEYDGPVSPPEGE
jgi:hypothetical protein